MNVHDSNRYNATDIVKDTCCESPSPFSLHLLCIMFRCHFAHTTLHDVLLLGALLERGQITDVIS